MDESLEITIGEMMRQAGAKLVTAESCTGGLIGHRLTNVPGSSEYYLGGIIAYAYEAKVALLGVQPHRTGEPQVVQGKQLSTDLAQEVIIDRNTALRSKLALGDSLTIRVTQGTKDEFYTLRVVGITGGQQYSLQPSIFARLIDLIFFPVWVLKSSILSR